MFQVFTGSWALFIGMFMLMIGNGLQGTLLGLRGDLEGFSTFSLSVVMSGYFLGFLFSSRFTPGLIRRVGHVRVFAALGSTISAVLIMYPILVEPWAWTIGRVVIGFCFCGVYITAESWLNDASTNETRGKALSLYMIVQMAGIVVAQYIVSQGDVSGYALFIIPSVLVSLAFAPILLSVRPMPAFETTKPMTIRQVIDASPLACFGMFMLGGVFAAQFGMSAVYGNRVGLSVGQISLFVSAIYVSALVLQYPIGWMSDRTDRRVLIIWVSLLGGFGSLLAFLVPSNFTIIVITGAIVGGTSNPLYALLIAYMNDYLEREDMAAASGGLLFINGLGAIMGPLIVGSMMDALGPNGFWLFTAVLMLTVGSYGLYRATRRSRSDLEVETVPYAPVSAASTAVVAEAAQEYYIEAEEEIAAEEATQSAAESRGRA
ncbi:MFS transporter [Yoonia sediminilitoris]|uniref:Putative MFS family arabinose efflux permease n=1 Tax=Yoonia sediminilitoris TaxID=1286148 RepID=A0A2T6KRE4_9RHOB|nr:MFS transporter [Yoonia sediminilitoris]PUB19131.1 putative MFS family arabinose efflux permease [Yoonia sediminilitoris]RCW99299.1 putative MFS family arabinose efflux permease [Yoonia sediminilitoris]